jgi:hypothetical protein
MGFSREMILIIIVVIGALFYMNSRRDVVEKPVYYPVYKTQYVNRDRRDRRDHRDRRDRRDRRPRPLPEQIPGSKRIPGSMPKPGPMPKPGSMPKPHDHEDTLHFISGVETPDL